MSQMPRWKGLKHFLNVTTLEYADGQDFYDTLRVSILRYERDYLLHNRSCF